MKMKKTTLAAIFLILPGVAVFLFFNIYPILSSIGIAFTDAQLGSYPIEETKDVVVTGLENFRWIMDDSAFKSAFVWTWLFVVVSVVCKVLFGLILALVYNSQLVKGRTVYRALLIIPWALPLLFTVLVWYLMFDPVIGPINLMLTGVGISNPPQWNLGANAGFFALVIIETWLAYPFMMTIITSALQSVPVNLIEASVIDGANYWNRLVRVILPIASRPIAFATIMTSATSFQYFLVPFIYNSALFEDRFLLLYGYRKGFAAAIPHYGRAAAALVIALVVLAVFMYVGMKVTKIQESAAK